MSAEIVIVRHGNTFDPGDVVRRVGARTDLPLSVSGRVQAMKLAAMFAREQAGFTHACCGPLARTRETAELILRGQAFPPELEMELFLREIDYGPDENQPESEVVRRIGEVAIADWESDGVVPPGWVVDVRALEDAWRDAFSRWARDGGRRLVVTSNGVARFALSAIGETRFGRRLATGAFGLIRLDGAAACAQAWNVRPG